MLTTVLVLLTCLAGGALVMLFEEKFIYFPVKYPGGIWGVERLSVVKAETTFKLEDCHFTAADGVNLHGWYCTPYRKTEGVLIPNQSDMTLLWFHGNAGNISHRYEMTMMLMDLPVCVFIIDYRGYGKSEGSPSEQGLYYDAQGAWDYLLSRRGILPSRIVIFGDSLGSAPAIDLASKVRPAGLIVQSGFTSAPDMAAAVMPFLPRFLMRTKMDSVHKIPSVRCPKLFIHSPADEIVPYKLGRRLFDSAPEPKEFYEIANAPHNETYIVGGKEYLDRLRRFVQSCQPKA
ncbi:MAG TPA: alpha/beta hydrolase [Acidobacteriota bacterium]